VNLPELLRDPVDHPERPLLYAGLAHGHGERGDPPVLGDVVVGTGQEKTPLGLVGVARPDLLARDDEFLSLAIGPGTQSGEVGTGIGLTESLAPAVPPVDDAGEETPPDLLAAVLENSLHQVAEAGPGRGPRRRELLVDNDLEHGREPLSPDLGGPGHGEESGVIE
jgi:hypothetical protein